MTLDEAIKHCEEKAKELNEQLDFIVDDEIEKECIACMLEHEQLAGWLKELKELRESRLQADLISRSELKAFIKKYYKQTSQIKSLLSFIDTQKGGAE